MYTIAFFVALWLCFIILRGLFRGLGNLARRPRRSRGRSIKAVYKPAPIAAAQAVKPPTPAQIDAQRRRAARDAEREKKREAARNLAALDYDHFSALYDHYKTRGAEILAEIENPAISEARREKLKKELFAVDNRLYTIERKKALAFDKMEA